MELSLLHSNPLRLLSLTTASLILAVGFGGMASAHVSKTDAGTAVLVHIIPDDLPQAGIETEISLSLSAKANNVSLPDCNCTVTLLKDNAVLSKLSLEGAYIGAGNEGIVKETFPTIGVYELRVQGSSKAGRFEPFAISYPIRVATAVEHMQRTSSVLFIGYLLSGAALLLGIALIGVKFVRIIKKR